MCDLYNYLKKESKEQKYKMHNIDEVQMSFNFLKLCTKKHKIKVILKLLSKIEERILYYIAISLFHMRLLNEY